MAYAGVSDLLLGDLAVSEQVDRQKFVDLAAEEMDSKLGWVYRLPLAPPNVDPSATSWMALQPHEAATLKSINSRLASGRLILSLAVAAEGTQLHALGWHYVSSALEDLMVIANGAIDLTAVRIGASDSAYRNDAPSVSQYDDESLLSAFENTVMRNRPWWTQPGAIP